MFLIYNNIADTAHVYIIIIYLFGKRRTIYHIDDDNFSDTNANYIVLYTKNSANHWVNCPFFKLMVVSTACIML